MGTVDKLRIFGALVMIGTVVRGFMFGNKIVATIFLIFTIRILGNVIATWYNNNK